MTYTVQYYQNGILRELKTNDYEAATSAQWAITDFHNIAVTLYVDDLFVGSSEPKLMDENE
jgi:hypothetical protein